MLKYLFFSTSLNKRYIFHFITLNLHQYNILLKSLIKIYVFLIHIQTHLYGDMIVFIEIFHNIIYIHLYIWMKYFTRKVSSGMIRLKIKDNKI